MKYNNCFLIRSLSGWSFWNKRTVVSKCRFLCVNIFILLIISSCADNTPWLPADLEKEQSDIDVAWSDYSDRESVDEDVVCGDGYSFYRGECTSASLVVVGVESWSLPESGHLLFAEQADIGELQEIVPSFPLGTTNGTDLTLASTSNKALIIGRDHHAFFADFDGETATEIWRTTDEESGYLNLQDGFFDEKEDRFCFVAMQSNDLLCFSNGKLTKTALEIPGEHEFYSPARILKIGRTVWITLQLLNSEWQSDGGVIVKLNLDTMEMVSSTLPLANPYGRIAWNPQFDENFAFIACSGNWQKRDGGVVRVNLETLNSEVILEESDKEGTILDGDFIDVQPTNDGNMYIILSDNREQWDNVLLFFDIKKGELKEVDRGLNAFAPLPMAYNPLSRDLFYFVDEKEKTTLIKRAENGEKERFEMEWGASAVRIFLKNNILGEEE